MRIVPGDDALALTKHRARWASLAGASRGYDGPACWERFAPPEWLGDPARCFHTGGASRSTAPPSRALAVALCSDPRETLRAESLAHTAAGHLARYGLDPPARVCWRAWEADFWQRGVIPALPDDEVTRAATQALTDLAMPPAGIAVRARTLGRNASPAVTLAYYREWWRDAFADDPIAERSPFEPMFELFLSGFWLASLDARELTLMAVAPELP